MKTHIRLTAAVLAMITLLPLSSCAPKNDIDEPDSQDIPSIPTGGLLSGTPSFYPIEFGDPETPAIIYPYVNPLTGLGSSADLAPMRPIVVSMNNLRESLPQSGIQSAEIIYEVLAEGGITRLIAVFADARTIPTIGSIRSTRPYIVDIATAYDPIFIHFGGSQDGKARVRQNKIMTIDGLAYDGTYIYRDAERRKKAGLEHSAFSNAELICEAAEKIKALSLERDPEDCIPAFKFANDPITPSESEAAVVKISFSNYNNKSTFTYLSDKGMYVKEQYGSDHLDEATGMALEVKNVFALKIPSRAIDNVGRREMNTTGSGEGLYITNGGAVSIKWARRDVYSQFTYTLSDGSELEVNPGNSYISIVNDLSNVTLEAAPEEGE